jgi:hypothetical protein
MEHFHVRGKPLTREQCDAQGIFYCDGTTTYELIPAFSGQRVHHAEIEKGSTEFGVTNWKCRHCGLPIEGTPESLEQL